MEIADVLKFFFTFRSAVFLFFFFKEASKINLVNNST